LRLVIGSWKIMETSLPRTPRISSSLSARRSRPFSAMEPEMRLFALGSSRMTESAVTLLPDPDSPTTATVSFGSTSRSRPFTAGCQAPSVRKSTFRSRMLSTAAGAKARETWFIRRTPHHTGLATL
jgi:hypothetical protein